MYVTALQRTGIWFGKLVMPDDRVESKIAMMRIMLLHFRHGRSGRMKIRRQLRRYHGAQRAFITMGSSAGIMFENGGWWSIPMIILIAALSIIY